MDEKDRHDKCRKYRRTRRNRLRYRKPRFKNRKKNIGGLQPSVRHIKDVHVYLYQLYKEICPINKVYVEIATFDTQLMEALDRGLPIPEGTDYQHGPRYGLNTLRDAVFARDEHKCIICGKKGYGKNGIALHTHHLGYWKKDRTDRLSNLGTVCDDCHTTKNHQPKGKLWGLEPITKKMNAPAYMNILRHFIYDEIKELGADIKYTYGSATKTTRRMLHLPKSHSNDAYVMGEFYPHHKCHEIIYEKQRRNNRILERFIDAKYIDKRVEQNNEPKEPQTQNKALDQSEHEKDEEQLTDKKLIKTGKELECQRTNRKIPRNNKDNLRIYRGKKVSKGRNSIRKQHYTLRPYDTIIYEGNKYTLKAVQSNGKQVVINGIKTKPSNNKVELLYHTNGWAQVPS